MKINKTKKLELAVSKCGRNMPSMEHVRYENGKAIATDGHILAVVNVSEYENDTDGPIMLDTFKMAQKATKKEDDIEIRANGSLTVPALGNASFNRDEGLEDFPNWKQCMPKDKTGYDFKIALNAELLFKLAKALGADNNTVVLNFKDKSSPVFVTLQNQDESTDKGIIMPVSLA